MFLVDSSIWIDYLRERRNQSVAWFKDILEHDYPFGITEQIYVEILQGASSTRDFERLRRYFDPLQIYRPRDSLESLAEAARLYLRCRQAGFTVRSTADCMIARIAIEHDLLLVHNDRDFEVIQSIEPELRIYAGNLYPEPQASWVHQRLPEYDPDGD